MRLLLILLLIPTAFAAPPRVRLLSVSDNTALIRVAEGSSETRIKTLVDTLHTAGITTFTFETNNDRLLNKLKSTWFDSGITNVAIRKPGPPSSTSFPKLDPITARATLAGIDDELELETARFETARKALVTFVYHHGIPETDDTTSFQDLTNQKQEAAKQLATFLDSPLETQLTLAAKIEIEGNPVAKHLASNQKAKQEKAQLATSGFGARHPKIVATNREAAATRQLAIDELGSIEEALRIQIYLLDQRAKHFKTWQQLPRDLRNSREQTYQKTKASYETSLRRIQEITATKKAAQRSLNQ